MSNKCVVITGYGVLSGLGENIADFSRRMFAGESGIRELKGTGLPEDFPVTIAGVIDRVALSGKLTREWDNYCQEIVKLELDVVRQAVAMMEKGTEFDSIVYGGIQAFHFESVLGFLGNPSLLQNANFGLGSTADYYCGKIVEMIEKSGFGKIPKENRICVNTACTSGTHSIGLAFENIRDGHWKRCLVIASDWRPLESGLMNFLLLKALSTSKEAAGTISRPFDKTRSGVVRAQGAGVMVLEAKDPRTKESQILAEVSGFGFTSDAYRLTDGREDVSCLKMAISEAISSAGISAADIDYVSAHGTSTRLNDRLESKAIREFFGERSSQIPISSLKSQTGHSISAAGMIESIGCVLMLQRQLIAPTINYHHKDTECNLDFVPNVSRAARIDYILKNSMAFGGQNACLIFHKA